MEKVRKASEEIEKITDVQQEESAATVTVKDETLVETILRQTPALLASFATTVILLFFMLAYENSFLRNVIRIFPAMRQPLKAVNIARDVSLHVSRYLFTIACINTGLGAAVSTWLCG